MSGNNSPDADAERKRKGKAIQLSDDEQKETDDNIEDLVSKDLSSVFYNLVEIGKGRSNDDSPGSLDDEDLSIYRMAFEIDGGGNFDDYVRRQKQALQYVEQTNILVQEKKTAGSLDDERKETVEDNMLKQNPSSSSTVPPGINYEDFSIYRKAFEIDGEGNFEDYVRRQKQALQLMEQTNIPVQENQVAKLLDEDAQIPDSETFSTISDANKEDMKLIFEVEITDRTCLLIPSEMVTADFPCTSQPETIHFTDDLDRTWEMIIKFSLYLNSFCIATGFNAYLECYHLNPPDLIRVYQKGNKLHINHQKNFGESLFTVRIPNSNRLAIPYDVASEYVDPSESMEAPNHLKEFSLVLTSSENQTYNLRFVCFDNDDAYIVVRGWEQYADLHKLNRWDTIRFFKKNHIQEKNKFTVCHEFGKRVDSLFLDSVKSSLILVSQFIGQLYLSEADVGFGRLEMPGIQLGSSDWFDTEMVKLTDRNKKDWYMITRYQTVSRQFIIFDGWEGFVEEHMLEAGDMVKFYKVKGTHDMHFLIEFVKKKKNPEKEEVVKTPEGESLFTVQIPNSNRLVIPYDVASEYFNPSKSLDAPDHLMEFTFHLTGSDNIPWELSFVCFDDDKAYIVFRGWDQYADYYCLNHRDTIRFFKKNPILEKNNFMVCHKSFLLDSVESSLVLESKYIGELYLSEEDVESGRLEMPGVGLASYDWFATEMVKLTDTNKKNWYMIIRYENVTGEFIMIFNGWMGFVEEHMLEAGDIVKFYKVDGSHNKHFLIEFVKKKKKNAEKEEGGEGSGKPDDAAELNRRRKGKEIVSGSLDDERKETVEDKTLKQNPYGISDEDFSIYQMAFDLVGGGNFDEFLRRQKHALRYVEQTNIPVQENKTPKLLDEDCDSDPYKEDTKLIFKVEMTDKNRLVIPEDMMSDYIPRMVQPETLHLIDSLDIAWEMTISFDTDVDNFIITTGLNAYVELHHLNPSDLIRVYLKDNEFRINHQQNNRESLFTVQIPRSNAEKEEGGEGSGKPDDAAELNRRRKGKEIVSD